jgi:hypothetical protein
MTADGDTPLRPAPGLTLSAGFLFAAPGLQSRSLPHDLFRLVPIQQGGFTVARAVLAMAHVVHHINCVWVPEYLTPSLARSTKA